MVFYWQHPDGEGGLGNTEENDFFVEITTSTERDTATPIIFPKDIIPAFIVKHHSDLEYIGEKAYCSKTGVVLKRKASGSTIKAEVRRTEDSKIVILVKNNDQNSCEFGAELIRDLYQVISDYKVFQDKQTRPLIKISYIDKKGREKSCEIEEVLEDDSLIKNSVGKNA